MSAYDHKGDWPAYPVPLNAGESYSGHAPCDGMTLRQYAAIKLRVPDSGTDWLDDMIRQSLQMELAGKAMPALIEALADSEMAEEEMRNLGLGERDFDLLIAKCAFDYARAVIKQWGKS